MTQAQWGRAPSTADDRQPDTAAWAYMVRCGDGSLYSGWTSDLARRLKAHRTGRGARYTRMRGEGGVRLAYAQRCPDKSAALRREAALKRLPKAEKEALAAAWAEEHRITIRMATPEDGPRVAELYNWYVTHSTATFQYQPSTAESYRENIAAVRRAAPFLLAETPDGTLQGFACAHPWHDRGAFAWDVETTVYCAPDCVGQGVGGRLYTVLLALLRRQGYCNALALVAHPNPDSEAMHRAMGFCKVGTEPRTGYKFGRWLDLQTWVLDLRPGTDAPAPVRLTVGEEDLRRVLEELETAKSI